MNESCPGALGIPDLRSPAAMDFHSDFSLFYHLLILEGGKMPERFLLLPELKTIKEPLSHISGKRASFAVFQYDLPGFQIYLGNLSPSDKICPVYTDKALSQPFLQLLHASDKIKAFLHGMKLDPVRPPGGSKI